MLARKRPMYLCSIGSRHHLCWGYAPGMDLAEDDQDTRQLWVDKAVKVSAKARQHTARTSYLPPERQPMLGRWDL